MPAEPVAQLSLQDAIQQGLRLQSGMQFQSTAQRILQHRLAGFQPIAPHGRDGDGGNDGYSRSLGIYTQIYAPAVSTLPGKQAARKATMDFRKLKRTWHKIRPIKGYWFVTNSEYSNEHVERALCVIKRRHRIETRYLGAAELASEAVFLPHGQIEKLMGFRVTQSRGGRRTKSALDLLGSVTTSQLTGLHLLASLHHPVSVRMCESLLPRTTNWKDFWSWLLMHRLATRTKDVIELDESVARQCQGNSTEQRKACELWVSPLQQHGSIDCLYLAIIPLLTLRRFKEAVRVLIRAGVQFDDGDWDLPLLHAVDLFINALPPKRIASDDRRGLRVARASLLMRLGRHSEAVAAFDTCLADTGGWPKDVNRGEMLINAGNAASNNNDVPGAQRWYEEAIEWARSHHDDWVLGRAATNMAQLLQDSELDRAERLIDEAEAAKFRCGDGDGLAAIEMARGRCLAFRQNPVVAHAHFKNALMLARTFGHKDVFADIYFNLGKSSGESQRWRKAASEYRLSLAEAIKHGQARQEARARVGLAHALFHLSNWKACNAECDKLARLPATKEWASQRLTGLHGRIVVRLRTTGRIARKDVVAALAFARRQGQEDWIGRLLVDPVLAAHPTPTQSALMALLRDGMAAQAAGRPGAAWHVYSTVWRWCRERDDRLGRVKDQAEALLHQLLRHQQTPPRDAVAYCRWIYGQYTELGLPLKALDLLRTYAARAKAGRLWDEYAGALDEQAINLSDLGRLESAETLHRRALYIARLHALPQQQRTSAGNLAECLRRLGRFREALRASRTALTLYEPERDPAGYLSVLNNHYLIQCELEPERARWTLKRCEALARRYGLVDEAIRVLVARGHAVWERGHLTLACKYFRRGLGLGLREKIPAAIDTCRYNLALALRDAQRPADAIRTLLARRLQPASTMAMNGHNLLAVLLEERGELSAAAAEWKRTAAVAAALRAPDRSHFEARARFLGTVTKRPLRLVRRAERMLGRAYGVRLGSHEHKRRFDEAIAFCEQYELVSYQAHAYMTLADQLGTRGRPNDLVTGARASVAAMLTGLFDRALARFVAERHGHWLMGLGLTRSELQKLRAQTSRWLDETLGSSLSQSMGPLLSGFDAVIAATTKAATPGKPRA